MQNLRKDYSKNALLEEYLADDPFIQFQHWFSQAVEEKVLEPNAMILSTRTTEGVDSRTVLLKGVENGQFIFFTNYNSHKGQQLLNDPHCSLLFLWLQEERQVIVRGQVKKLNEAASETYFKTRPRGSQIGAWVSEQSKPIANRGELENRLKVLNERFEEKDVPRPKHWGGFSVFPYEIEFWQGRSNRLHDRILYSKGEKGWTYARLQP